VSGDMPGNLLFDELEMDPLTVAGFVSGADTVALLAAAHGQSLIFGQRNINLIVG
jgi:hypothetical protein